MIDNRREVFYMSFSDKLNEYMNSVGCTAKELARASGVSQATLSRYRNFKRNAKVPVKLVTALSKGLNILSDGRIKYEEVYAELSKYTQIESYDLQSVVDNLNNMIDKLDINASELAKSLNFDASYLSRIRNGKRNPSDMRTFVDGVAGFVAKKAVNPETFKQVCLLTKSDGKNIQSDIATWLIHGTVRDSSSVYEFLTTLDSFNLDEYISAVHFDDLKTPTLPFSIPTNKNYYGIEEMRKGELAFYRNAVLSKSTEDFFMHSQMPITEMAQDRDFYKKMMIAVAMILKKGIHIHIIHSLDRPWNEMMLGLEAWIPLYMTGQITPYYLENSQNGVYTNGLMVAGTAALIGEGVSGFPEDSKYYVTTNKDEITYYRRKADNLLRCAVPLMEIYRENMGPQFGSVLNRLVDIKGDRYVINHTLPITTVSDKLFFSIMQRNAVKRELAEKLWEDILDSKRRLETILENNIATDEIPLISEENFGRERIALSLSNMFFPTPVYYTYEDYCEHLALTEKFAREHENYKVVKSSKRVFKNIKISVIGDQAVLISKDKTPTIHFVIRHPKLISAISGFEAIVRE